MLSQRAAQGTRDYGEVPDDRSCTRLLFPYSESLGLSGSDHSFRRESSECARDLVAVAQV